MIYMVHRYSMRDGSMGHSYHGSKAEALAAARDDVRGDPDAHVCRGKPLECAHPVDLHVGIQDCAETPRTKAQVVALLNAWASHPGNG